MDFQQLQISRTLSNLLTHQFFCQYRHFPSGRLYEIRFIGRRLFVREYIPTGILIEAGEYLLSDSDIKSSYMLSPNDFMPYIARKGYRRDQIEYALAESTSGAILHDDFDGVAGAILESIANNKVMKSTVSQEERLASMTPLERMREELQEARATLAYWQRELHNKGLQGTILSGAHDYYGPLQGENLVAVLAYFNRPTPANWDKCYGVMVVPNLSLYCIWRQNDQAAPDARPDDGKWRTTPSPARLLKWIQMAFSERRKVIKAQIQSLTARIAELEIALSDIASES